MDNSDIKPSTIMLIVGGAVLLLSTFLDWVSVGSFGVSAWNSDGFGLFGIYTAVIGLAIAGGVAATQFGNVSLPDRILGFSHDQIHAILSGAAVLISFGFITRGNIGIGLILALLASATMLAASIMDLRAGDSSAAAPPTQF
jgi:hypothetical protein